MFKVVSISKLILDTDISTFTIPNIFIDKRLKKGMSIMLDPYLIKSNITHVYNLYIDVSNAHFKSIDGRGIYGGKRPFYHEDFISFS